MKWRTILTYSTLLLNRSAQPSMDINSSRRGCYLELLEDQLKIYQINQHSDKQATSYYWVIQVWENLSCWNMQLKFFLTQYTWVRQLQQLVVLQSQSTETITNKLCRLEPWFWLIMEFVLLMNSIKQVIPHLCLRPWSSRPYQSPKQEWYVSWNAEWGS